MADGYTIRFLNNFVLTTIDTYLDTDGNLKTKENQYHIQRGDIVKVKQYTVHHEHLVDIEFYPDSVLKGVANNIEKDYCEALQVVSQSKSSVSGCSSCGSK